MRLSLRRNILLTVMLIFVSAGGFLQASEANNEQSSFDIKEMIFSHVADAYDWHLLTIGDENYSIPLPIIVKGENGWTAFSSAHITEGGTYKGFYLATDDPYKNKVVYNSSEGDVVRPIDLSFTKNAAAAMLASLLLLVIMLSIASRYKKDYLRPMTGFAGAIEQLTMSLHDDLIKPNIPDDYEKFAPYLLTVFYFIFINNMMGLIPVFPGGANVTGNIAVTLTLALLTFFISNIFGTKVYWREIFWPDVPTFLKTPVFPLMQLIEIIGMFTKPFSLMVRLFANMLAGHMIVLVLMGLIFIFVGMMGVGVAAGVSLVSIAFAIFMFLLDVLVSFIQAYVFTILSSIFIGMTRVQAH